LTTFIDHRHISRSKIPGHVPAEQAPRAFPRAWGTVAVRTDPARPITDQQSPKRCSTIPARQKDQSFGWGIHPSQGRASRRSHLFR
jgi:hypothetical protein